MNMKIIKHYDGSFFIRAIVHLVIYNLCKEFDLMFTYNHNRQFVDELELREMNFVEKMMSRVTKIEM